MSETSPLNALVFAYNNGQVLLGREGDLKKFTDRNTAVKRLEKLQDELFNMHGYAELMPDLTWNIHKPIMTKETEKPKRHGGDAIIRLAVESNPKRPGSAAFMLFSLYQDGALRSEFLARAVQHGHSHQRALLDLRWNVKAGFLRLEV